MNDTPTPITAMRPASAQSREPVTHPTMWIRSIERVCDPAAGAALILRGDLDLHDAVSITCARVLVLGTQEFIDHVDVAADHALAIWDGSKHPPMLALDDLARGPDDCFAVEAIEEIQ